VGTYNYGLQEVNTTRTPVEVINFLENVTNPDVMRSLVVKDATYVSLTCENITIQDRR
jgi:hypothetical protein